jgi:hypothetical protein
MHIGNRDYILDVWLIGMELRHHLWDLCHIHWREDSMAEATAAD